MTDEVSNRARSTGDIVTGSFALASLIFVDVTALHSFFGVLLLVYWGRNFNKPSSIRDRAIVSMAMSLALLLIFSYPLNFILNRCGKAQSWDIVLLILGIVFTISFFVLKPKFELGTIRGET